MSLMRRRDLLQRSASALLAASLAKAGPAAHAAPGSASGQGVELQRLALQRTDEGALLSYDVRIDLPDDLEQALGKGIAVVFVAEAELFRERWYWTDESRARAVRRWRLAYQPLTRAWRLSQEGLSRNCNSLTEALDSIRRTERWRIADLAATSDDGDYHVDFSFRLDTHELPRPLQIGLGGPFDWKLEAERRVALPASR
ncbi:MAG: DUF4390 domain-containing protein [Aquabacterium sp.]